MTNNTESKKPKSSKYNYVIKNPAGIRLVNLQALIGVLLAFYGVTEFLKLNIWYAVFFGPLVAIIILANLLTHLINLFYPEFSIEKHQKFVRSFWQNNQQPSVDVFLPVAGEDIDTIRLTWQGVRAIKYSNFQVYVLDDKNDSEVATLAKEFDFNYLTRPNLGEFKKAGNLEYGYSQSTGDFVIVFDADFCPITECLHESIPYIASDKKMSILQTPQYFQTDDEVHNRSAIEYGAGAVVEDFYRVTLPAKMRFGLAMCVGTSVIYRRQVIEEVGVPHVDHTEDLIQGLMTLKKGYHIGYLPIIISQGKCPDNLQTYYKQQSRWAYGCLEATVSPDFWSRRLDNWTKINYFSSTLYYLAEALSILMSFQILALLFFNTDSIQISWVWPFALYLSYQLFTKYWITLNRNRRGSYLAGHVQIFTYFEALIRFLRRRPIGWQASNSKSTVGRQISDNFWLNVTLSTIFIAFYQVLLAIAILARPDMLLNIEIYVVLAVALWRAWWYAYYNIASNWFLNTKLVVDMKGQWFQLKIWQLLTFTIVIGSSGTLVGVIIYGLIKDVVR